jgi:hypothetical protein
MLRLAFNERRDWRLRSIRFKTELTKPALCAFVALGALISVPITIAKAILRGNNFFINTPLKP